jgi:hypothetical protein
MEFPIHQFMWVTWRKKQKPRGGKSWEMFSGTKQIAFCFLDKNKTYSEEVLMKIVARSSKQCVVNYKGNFFSLSLCACVFSLLKINETTGNRE